MAQPLKTPTIRQPWASLIMSGEKRVENRPFRTHYRGPLAIHAARLVDRDGTERFPDVQGARGFILGTVELFDCVRDVPPRRRQSQSTVLGRGSLVQPAAQWATHRPAPAIPAAK